MQIKVTTVNAFITSNKGGNPAGIVFEDALLSDQQRLAIADKVGFSETAFVSSSTKATHKIRFFTPTEEVDLCGHATIATWSLMHKLGIHSAGTYTQDTLAGVLKVSISSNGLIFMEQITPRLFEFVERNEITSSLRVDISDFDADLKPQVVSTGLKDLLVPVKNELVLNKITPDIKRIIALSKAHDVTGLHVFCPSSQKDSFISARNFAPLVGIPEEAATGTSSGALLCYMKEHHILPKQDIYRIEQGRAMRKLSYIYGKFEDKVVWIGGKATVIGEHEIEVA